MTLMCAEAASLTISSILAGSAGWTLLVQSKRVTHMPRNSTPDGVGVAVGVGAGVMVGVGSALAHKGSYRRASCNVRALTTITSSSPNTPQNSSPTRIRRCIMPSLSLKYQRQGMNCLSPQDCFILGESLEIGPISPEKTGPIGLGTNDEIMNQSEKGKSFLDGHLTVTFSLPAIIMKTGNSST